MYNFNYIKFRGYLTYRDEQFVPLNNQGLIWLEGLNHDSKKGSNGSGKSILLEFIYLMLYDTATDEIMFEDKNFLGELSFSKDDKEIRILQFRKLDKKLKTELAASLKIDEKSFKASGYLIFLNNKNITPHGIPSCKKKISQLFDLTEDEFLGTVHVTPNRAHTLLSGTPAARRQYFENAFSILNTYKILKDKIGDKYDKLDEKIRNLDEIKAQLKTYESQLLELKDLDTLNGLVEDLSKKYEICQAEKVELENKIKDIDSKRAINKSRKDILQQLEEIPVVKQELSDLSSSEKEKEDKLETLKESLNKYLEYNELNNELVDIKEKAKQKNYSPKINYAELVQKLEKEETTFSLKLNEAQVLLKKFSKLTQECPTCNQPVDKKFISKNIEKLNSDISLFGEQLKDIDTSLTSYKEANKLISKYNDMRKRLDKFETLDINEDKTKASIKKLKEELVFIRENKTNLQKRQQLESLLKKYPEQDIPSKVFYDKMRERLVKANSEFEILLKEKTEYELQAKQVKKLIAFVKQAKVDLVDYDTIKNKLKIYDALYVAYGDKGLKLKQITNICKKLVEQLPKYTNLMFQEKNLTFTTNTDKDNFDIIAHRNFKGRKKKFDVKRFSAGEKKRFIPALMLAQNSLLPSRKRCNLFLADELDGNMDYAARQSFVNNLIPVLNKKFNTVIVVSHAPDMKPQSCKNWIVEKKDGISNLIKKL